MGYSCTAKASFVVEAVEALIAERFKVDGSNAMPDGGFFERGRENADGAITGTVFKPSGVKLTDAERAARAAETGGKPEWVGDPVVKSGSYKVSADGKIVRWPGLSKELKAEAEKRAAARYSVTYERTNILPPMSEIGG